MTEHNSLIPKWTTNNDQQDELEAYLASLKEAARLQICETEQLLIYASLQKSNKIDIYLSLNLKQKTNITDFANITDFEFSYQHYTHDSDIESEFSPSHEEY